jgi:ribosome biogenesis ATPase
MAKGRSFLQNSLDREIYQVVRKILDEQELNALTVRSSSIYDSIQKSNSSLKRRPKRQLEDSIERVLTVMREDASDLEDDIDTLEGDFDVNPKPEPKRRKEMNDIVTSGWSTSQTATPANSGKPERKRKPDRNHDANAKKVKKDATELSPPPNYSFRDLGGVEDVVQQLKDLLILPLLMPERYLSQNYPIPRGILLHGPPGCGKTAISRACASSLGVPFIEILGPAVVSGMSGESEKQVRELFQRAKDAAPCLLFIDEIDVIAPKRDTAQSQMEKRIVAQLLISMDSLAMNTEDDKPVIVLAATNRPDSLDPALRRGGRFDTEINMGVPNESMRAAILKSLTRKSKVDPDVDFKLLAKKTSGFVGADLKDLVGKAGTWSMTKYREALEKQAAKGQDNDHSGENSKMEIDDPTSDAVFDVVDAFERLVQRCKDKALPQPEGFEDETLKMAAFEAVLPGIQPSSKREGFATVPNVTWNDVGALQDVREEMHLAIVEPISYPERYKEVGITAPTGILLWGPPGCGKTLLAKAAAAESKANFISIKGPELLNKVSVNLEVFYHPQRV